MAKALNDTLGVKRAIKHFDFSEPYWQGTREKKLMLQYCKATGKYQHFPRPVSIFTGRRRDIAVRFIPGNYGMSRITLTIGMERRSNTRSWCGPDHQPCERRTPTPGLCSGAFHGTCPS